MYLLPCLPSAFIRYPHYRLTGSVEKQQGNDMQKLNAMYTFDNCGVGAF